MTPTHALLLLQAAETINASHAVAIYLADAAALGAFGFAWRTNSRLARIETLLAEPGSGVVDTLRGAEGSIDSNGRQIERHEIRLDNHDKEIERLDRDKEPRRAAPPRDFSISPPDRSRTP